MSQLNNSVFGMLVVNMGLLKEEQVSECLELQKKYEQQGRTPLPRLGEIMASRNYLTVEQVKDILKRQKRMSIKINKSRIKAARDEIGSFLKPGKMFANYCITEQLGTDANGMTAKSQNTENGRTVSLRALTLEAMKDKGYVKLFKEHALKASKLEHPNIMRIISVGSFENRLYYTSQFLEGVSLRRLIKAKECLNPEMVVNIGISVLEALLYSHSRGIYHWHLSPARIIITPERKIKVAGFGSVPSPISDLKELTDTVGNTPFYIAPEQAVKSEGNSPDQRTDIYSLGSILYHALTGSPPFSGNSLEEVLLSIAEYC